MQSQVEVRAHFVTVPSYLKLYTLALCIVQSHHDRPSSSNQACDVAAIASAYCSAALQKVPDVAAHV